jgi:hypothetical protein
MRARPAHVVGCTHQLAAAATRKNHKGGGFAGIWRCTGSGFGNELLALGVEPRLGTAAVEDGHGQPLLQLQVVPEGSRAGVHLPPILFDLSLFFEFLFVSSNPNLKRKEK